MPKTKISEYSVTNSSNTDIEGINIDEGCAPSGINNAIRELMVHLKEFQTGASGDAFTFAGGVLISGTANTITGNVLMSGTNTITGSTTATFAAGAVGTPSIAAHGDTNTGIFFPAADTIAFAEGGAEAMRIDSSGRLLIGTTSGTRKLTVYENAAQVDVSIVSSTTGLSILQMGDTAADNQGQIIYRNNGDSMEFAVNGAERMRIDSSGNVGIGTSSPASKLHISGGTVNTARIDGSNGGGAWLVMRNGTITGGIYNTGAIIGDTTSGVGIFAETGYDVRFYTNGSATERARITSGGALLVATTTANPADNNVAGSQLSSTGSIQASASSATPLIVNRKTDDGNLVAFLQDGTSEGTISVSGNTVSYNSFAGSHWSQLQQGRGYNPDILRGTVMSTIGEMCEWKSVVWDEVIEHPAVPAVEAKEAVVDEEGNVIKPAIEAVEGKDAWTETIPHREAYLGNLAIGATFTEDGVTKTVVDDGNERLPKVKISDVVGDRAVYGVFQTWDEVQDMLVTSLGAFVVRIAAGVTVQIGDLLESNGDGCAKVQDDDVIRSKTIGKVTSTTPSATYADGSYTVPAVLYCG